MKIVSKFKDYYDYCQNLYGFDDLITFNRVNKVEHIESKQIDWIGYYSLFNSTIYFDSKNKECDSFHKYAKMVICRKSYLFLNNKVYLITQSEKNSIKDISKIEINYSSTINSKFGYLFDYMKQHHIPYLLLYKQNKNDQNQLYDFIEINPKLDSLKFFNFLSAEMVYQEIEQFFINLKNNETIIQVDNKNKIVQAGFDLKTSFRKAKQ